MQGEVEPFFNLSIPDWEYLAVISAGGIDPFGKEVDFLSVVYKDDEVKVDTRIKFDSGDVIKALHHYSHLEEAISHTKEVISQLPGFEIREPEVILNTTTKGQDLLDAMFKNTNIEIKVTRIERPERPINE